MSLEKPLVLSETTYYILLCLQEPNHGYAAMNKIIEMSEGRVRIAAGTMYGALDNLWKHKLIREVQSDEPRRRKFQTTEEGNRMLSIKAQQLERMVTVYKEIMKES